jgi:hypothetical protein
MKPHRERGRAKYRLTVKLDREWDADPVGWLEGMAPGSRSALIRDTLRAGLRQPGRWEPVDIEEMRRVVAEELARALAGRSVEVEATDPDPPEDDLEARYGDRLDKMLGGLRTPGPGSDETGTREQTG